MRQRPSECMGRADIVPSGNGIRTRAIATHSATLARLGLTGDLPSR